MSDVPQETARGCSFDFCGCGQLFRAFRLAIHPTKIILAFCAIFLTYLAGRCLDGMWSTKSSPAIIREAGITELSIFVGPGGGAAATSEWIEALPKKPDREGVFSLLLGHARTTVNLAARSVVALNLHGVAGAIHFGLLGIVWLFVMHLGYAILFLVVSMMIWAFFGGALARVAALHATRDERLGIRDALDFSRQKFVSFVGAPLMPLGVIFLVGAVLWLGGLVGLIPGLGEVLVGLVFFLPMMAGFVLAFAIIGGVAGFPLTYPTIAVEGSDAFDSLSRTFSYVYQRPWRTALYTVLSIGYGSICVLFVKFFVSIMLGTMHLFVGLSMNWGSPRTSLDEEAAATLPGKLDAIYQAPKLNGMGPFYGTFDDPAQLANMSWFAQFLIKGWIYGLWALVAAFVVSMFYCASTLIYLLLRRDVDATDLEEVYLEEPAVDAAPASSPPPTGGTSLPVVGQG